MLLQSCLLLACQFIPQDICLLVLSLTILLPLQAAKSGEKNTGRRAARCGVRRLKISVASSSSPSHMLCPGQQGGRDPSFWGPMELGLNPSPAIISCENLTSLSLSFLM